MGKTLLKLYGLLFGRKTFVPFHLILLKLSLKGLGFFNTADEQLSGETIFLRKLLRQVEQPVVLDVGANVGTYSNRIRAFSPEASIYAFEPHPQTFKRLQDAARTHGYTALNMGCDHIAGLTTLYDDETKEGGTTHASLYRNALEQLHNKQVSSWDIQVTTLDQFFADQGIPKVHLLKIDTEGNELRVLEGAHQSIANQVIDVIQFEFNQMNVISRVFFKDFHDIMPNYTFYRLLPHGITLLDPYQPVLHEMFGDQNVVAIHSACPVRL
jgi:FkbM family methyltransferase